MVLPVRSICSRKIIEYMDLLCSPEIIGRVAGRVGSRITCLRCSQVGVFVPRFGSEVRRSCGDDLIQVQG